MNKSKRGQTNVGINGILMALLLLFLASVVIVTLVDVLQNNAAIGEAIPEAFQSVGNAVMKIFQPLLGFLLGLETGDTTLNFLKVLTFILITIIIVSVLDMTAIFGEGKKGDIVNLAIGVIVSIIGIRFMPDEAWASLTTPASAFVATILVAIPFAALFFITIKLKSRLGRKLMWIFYILFLSYLITVGYEAGTIGGWIVFTYILFIILAGIMMFLDAEVRRYFYGEKRRKEAEDALKGMGMIARQKLRDKMEGYMDIMGKNKPSSKAYKAAEKEYKAEMKHLKKIGVEVEDL